MDEIKLFDMCKGKGFYKKTYDGRFVYLDKTSLTADLVNSSNETLEKDIESAEKTYYEYVEANCRGVVVGFIDLVVKGYLDVIYQDACDVGVGVIPEKFFVEKRPKEVVKCAVVYYANNRKHYVPLDGIEKLDIQK